MDSTNKQVNNSQQVIRHSSLHSTEKIIIKETTNDCDNNDEDTEYDDEADEVFEKPIVSKAQLLRNKEALRPSLRKYTKIVQSNPNALQSKKRNNHSLSSNNLPSSRLSRKNSNEANLKLNDQQVPRR